MKQMIVSHKWIVIILCILVGIYFLWPIITEESTIMPDSSVLAADMSKENTEKEVDSNLELSDGKITSNTDEKDIIVYVTGAIQSPGLYKLSSVSTVGDVIKGAGGALPYADVETINLAETVQGGQHVHIKFNFHGNPEVLLRNQKININTASVKELDALPGIGPTMAKRIEEYRQSKGAFTSIEDIKHVKGIGDGLFKKIRHRITV
ncbi:MAG: ComEA family DNA-binding protein [Veillonella tobetsuensis]|nr:ComEA family DNA-binding protein [Veillonella tobetsuensis]